MENKREMNVQSALEKNVIKLNFMEYPLEYGRDVKCDCEFLMKSSFISSSLFAFAIFTHFQRNDGCIHLANVCDCFWDFPMNGLVCGRRTTYFEHGWYDSVAASDGNEIAD